MRDFTFISRTYNQLGPTLFFRWMYTFGSGLGLALSAGYFIKNVLFKGRLGGLKERVLFLQTKLCDERKNSAALKTSLDDAQRENENLVKKIAEYEANSAAHNDWLKCFACGDLHLKLLRVEDASDPVYHFECESCGHPRVEAESALRRLKRQMNRPAVRSFDRGNGGPSGWMDN